MNIFSFPTYNIQTQKNYFFISFTFTTVKLDKDYLLSQNISDKNIIYMNFESADWYHIKDYQDLYNYIRDNIQKGKNYILLDEVQNIEMWEKAVNSLLVDIDCDIYITGSNAYLLSSELTTLLAGRVLTIKIYPLSFKEFLSEYPFKNNEDKYDKFDKYLKFGGMPMLVNMNNNENLIYVELLRRRIWSLCWQIQ